VDFKPAHAMGGEGVGAGYRLSRTEAAEQV
jgi:hypothetical protein